MAPNDQSRTTAQRGVILPSPDLLRQVGGNRLGTLEHLAHHLHDKVHSEVGQLLVADSAAGVVVERGPTGLAADDICTSTGQVQSRAVVGGASHVVCTNRNHDIITVANIV
jgi:hypothetical protein